MSSILSILSTSISDTFISLLQTFLWLINRILDLDFPVVSKSTLLYPLLPYTRLVSLLLNLHPLLSGDTLFSPPSQTDLNDKRKTHLNVYYVNQIHWPTWKCLPQIDNKTKIYLFSDKTEILHNYSYNCSENQETNYGIKQLWEKPLGSQQL